MPERETYEIQRSKTGTFELSVERRESLEDQVIYFIQGDPSIYV